MGTIHALAKDIDLEVQSQGSKLKVINNEIELAGTNVEKGVFEVTIAERRQRMSTKLTVGLVLCILLVVIVMLILLIKK